MTEPLVAIIVLNWNKASETLLCVEALLCQTYANLRVIVVDNGSIEPIGPIPATVTLLQNSRNLGFAGGVNVGIARALTDGAEYIWLVNNDAIPDPHALSRCVDLMKMDCSLGLVSPVILNADANSEVEFCGGFWDGKTFSTTVERATYQRWHEESAASIWLVGTAMLIKRSLAETIGFFDDAFFAYWEDNDYCVRAIHAKFRCAIALDGTVHHSSGTPKTHPELKPVHYHYYMARNELLFIRKNLVLRDQTKPLIWAVKRQLGMINRLLGYPSAMQAIVVGLWDGMLGRGGEFEPSRRAPSSVAFVLSKIAQMSGQRTNRL
jgi:GT2 family glycosyltransferase